MANRSGKMHLQPQQPPLAVSAGSDDPPSMESLLRENEKLKKINRVLIDRIERGLANDNGAYASFESAVVLSEKVKERTQQLQQALKDLERVNQDLFHAKNEAEQKHQLLIDAIESISDAFVLFDQQRIFVLANTAFYQLWENAGLAGIDGMSMPEMQKKIFKSGIIDYSTSQSEKLTSRSEISTLGIFRLTDGRWMQATERPSREGGLVMIFTDITAIKRSEEAKRERALAEKSKILQSTLDHLSQGVALFNSEHQLEAWNEQFISLAGISPDLAEQGVSLQTLLALGRVDPRTVQRLALRQVDIRLEQALDNGTIMEIESHNTGTGAIVVTYTDITEQRQYEEALRASEHRIRLVTDAMPALISYIDRDLNYNFTNRAFEEWFKQSRDEIDQKSMAQLLGPEEFARHREYLERTLGGQRVVFEIEQQLPGGSKYVLKTYVPNFDSNGQVAGFFALEQDVTQQRLTSEALNQAYRHMEKRVLERTKELTELNQQLRLEVTERQEAETRLFEAKREAEIANIAKTKFLAAVSHDLLQPMSAAKLFASALQEYQLPDGASKLLESLNYSMADVESLVSTLIDISKLDAGVVTPDLAPFDCGVMLENLANEFRQQAERSQLNFRFVPSSVTILTDRQLLARILRNFLSNAIRYTDSGDILLGCRRRPEGLLMQVWDSGIGIPAEQLEEIFLEFKRLPSNKRRSTNGLGLGLAIVDKISRILGHPVDVHSEPGRGSVFSILVPYGERQVPTPARVSTHPEEQGSALQGKRILVIDNDVSICQGMEVLLRGWGCEVMTATGLDDIDVEALREAMPDLSIADYHLDDGATGIDAVEVLHQQLGQAVPTLMITANYSQELKQKVRKSGYHLLNKPIKLHKLKVMLQHLFQGAPKKSI